MKTQIKDLIESCKDNANNHGWLIVWNNEDFNKNDFKDKKILSVGDAIALLHSELSEALEAYRDNDKIHFSEEIADEFIRLFHLCGDLNIDIETAIEKKMDKNKLRPKNHGRANL